MSDLLLLCAFAFLAGFVDSIVGGGGLIQTPALLITLPYVPVPTVMGTAKVSSIFGTSVASYQLAKQVVLRRQVLLVTTLLAGFGSFVGARLIHFLHPSVVKPVILVLLIVVFIYMLLKKDFGQTLKAEITGSKSLIYSGLFGFLVGVYDGFLGPGTGSFLILFFVSVLGFDFLLASAHAKLVNFATNLGALFYFFFSNNILWQYALPMGVSSMVGSYFGSKAAVLRGNQFIRYFFLGIILLMIGRYGYDIFK
jgi:uncharacterized protein